MSVILGFIIAVMSLLLIYMAYRLFLRRKVIMLISLCLQIVAVTIAILAFVGNVETNNFVESIFITFGVAVPCIFFVIDYTRMMKKIREQGVYEGFVEAAAAIEDDDGTVEISHKSICPIIKEIQVADLIKDMDLNKEDILKNIRKSLNLAQASIKNNDYDSAYDIYGTLVRLINNSSSLFYNYANTCYCMELYSEALQNYRKVVEINEKTIREINSDEEILSVDKKFSRDTQKESKTEKEILFEQYKVYYNMGNSCFKLGRYEQALENYEKALGLNPDMENVNENIARTLIALEKSDEALEFFQKIVNKDSENSSVHFVMAKIYEETKSYKPAISELQKCVELNPLFYEAYEELAKLYVKTADFQNALEVYRKIIDQNPENYKACYNLGTTLYRMDKKEEAVDMFRKVIELNPESYQSYFNLAVALDELGEKDEAIDSFKRVIDIKADFIEGYNNLGILLSTEGRHMEALNIYITGLKKNPEEYSLYYNMGITLSEMGRYLEAVDAYRSALEIKSDEHEIMLHLGSALAEIKKYSEAADVYRKALKIKTDDSSLYYNLSEVCSLQKKKDAAIDNLKKAVALDKGLKKKIKYNAAFDYIRNMPEFKELIS